MPCAQIARVVLGKGGPRSVLLMRLRETGIDLRCSHQYYGTKNQGGSYEGPDRTVRTDCERGGREGRFRNDGLGRLLSCDSAEADVGDEKED